MPSSVNRYRRKKAFMRGYERPQTFNPYKNPILDALWKRGKEERLKKTGGVMPPPPQKKVRRPMRGHNSPNRGGGGQRPGGQRPDPGNRRSYW